MKKYLAVLALAGGLTFGEYVQPYSQLKETMQYRNIPIAESFPNDPWNYEVQRELIVKDDKTYQGLFLVNEEAGIHKKIDENGCTCGLSNSIDDFMHDAKEWVGDKVQSGKEWVQETYKDLTE